MGQRNSSLENLIRQMIQSKWVEEIGLFDLQSDQPIPSEKKTKVIGVGAELEPSEVINKALTTDVTHIVQENSLETDLEVNSSAKLLIETDEFIGFPVSSILSPGNATESSEKSLRKYELTFSRSDEKNKMLEDLEAYVGSVMKRKSMISEVLSVADEIFSNAVFNAPYVNDKEIRGTSRSDGVVQADKEALFVAGDNGTRLALAVIDQYGSLNVNRLLKQIQRTYKEGAENSIQLSGTGGAGLGTYMIFESCLSMYLVVKPGEYTIVGVTMPLSMNRREKFASPKNLHCMEVA